MSDLKAKWNKKGKKELHSFCQNTKGIEEKVTLKGTIGMALLCGSMR
jgi:hypothetical protein